MILWELSTPLSYLKEPVPMSMSGSLTVTMTLSSASVNPFAGSSHIAMGTMGTDIVLEKN